MAPSSISCFGAHIFRCEQQLFGIHQQHAGFLAGFDHLVRFFQGEAQRFFDDDVFAGFGSIQHHLMVQDHSECQCRSHRSLYLATFRDSRCRRRGCRALWQTHRRYSGWRRRPLRHCAPSLEKRHGGCHPQSRCPHANFNFFIH